MHSFSDAMNSHTPAFQGKVFWRPQSGQKLNCTTSEVSSASALFRAKESMQKSGMVNVSAFGEPNKETLCVLFGNFFADAQTPSSNVHRLIDGETHTLENIDGEYALAGWNERQKTLTLMTDASATRPIFYTEFDGGMAFATDIESLLPYCDDQSNLDLDEVSGYLINHQWRSPDRTMIKEIRKIPPATIAKFSNGTRECHEYWQPEHAPSIRYKTHSEYFEHGRELLKASVRNRMQVSRSFGVHLSGGLDSSIIAAIASTECAINHQRLPTGFAWQPGAIEDSDPTLDQRLFKSACKAFGIEGINVSSDLRSEMEFLNFDPVRSPVSSTLALEHRIMRKASDLGYNSILSGWGGDQVVSFPGYLPGDSGLIRFFRQFPRRMLKPKSMTRTYFRTGNRHTTRLESVRTDWSRRTPRLAQIANIRMSATAERMESWSVYGAQHDLQYSYPLLDRRLIDFALGIPPELFRTQTHNRNLMRQIMDGLAPDEIRLNPDKDEPARFANSDDVKKRALEQALQLLNSKKFDAARAEYLNFEKLKRDIELLLNGTKRPMGKITRALSFINLDFENDETPGT